MNIARPVTSSPPPGGVLTSMVGHLAAGTYEVLETAIAALERLGQLFQPGDNHDKSIARMLYLDSPDAYLIVNEGRVISCNRAAEVLFAGARDRLVGQPLADLALPKQPDHRPSRALIEGWLDEAQRKGRAGGELMARRLDGTEFWSQVIVSPLGQTGAPTFMALWRDITESHVTDERMRQLSQAVEQSPVTIVITNCAGTIEYVNRKFTEVTGYSREEAIGQNPRVLKSGEQGPEVYRELWATIADGREWRGELHNRRKDGTLYWESVSISAIRQPDGRITHYLAVKEDIDARKRAELEIQQTNAALEAAIGRTQEMTIQAEMATIAKSEFLARMSHEIRTPMNGVIGMTGLLLDTPLNETQRKFAEIVRASADALLTIINDILDFSKIEAGKLKLEMVQFDLRETLTGVVEILAPRAQAKGVELVCDVAPEVPAVLQGDPGRLRQILVNLLGNSIKFTEKGEVVLQVRVDLAEAGFARFRFEIADTGIGIPADKLGLLFTAFTQVDGSNTRRFGGTGLGLAIAKQLVELMEGSVGVASEVGRGSTFWFELKLKVPPAAKRPADRSTDGLRGLRVLVVDDNATSRQLLARRCGSLGCVVTEAADGAAGIRILQEAAAPGPEIALVLVDQFMPGMGGLEFGRQVRSTPSGGAADLVLLTAPGAPRSRVDAAGGGFDQTLSKPIAEEALRNCLVRVAGKRSPTTPSAASPATARAAGAAIRGGRVLVAEDNSTNQLVAVGVLRKLGLKADIAANGLEAVRLLGLVPYDLVLMDCQMPEMDGYEATKFIRRGEGKVLNPRIPIIAMTADAMVGVREECLAVGMNDYVAKPISLGSLAATLAKWLPPPSEGEQRAE